MSDAVIAAAKAEGWKDLSGVKLAYCPMVKRSWLQKDEKISNPYYGTPCSTAASSRSPRLSHYQIHGIGLVSRNMATAPRAGPGTSNRNAHCHPVADATIGSRRMLIIVNRNPRQI